MSDRAAMAFAYGALGALLGAVGYGPIGIVIGGLAGIGVAIFVDTIA